MGNIQTPIEQGSNLPLLFVPREEILPLLYGVEDNSAVIADVNHVNHPKPSPLLQGDNGGFAVRQARGQFVLRKDHNNYHDYYGGPWLPATRDERLQAVVLSAADYIPAQAMDFSHRRPRIVTLSEMQRERLRTSGEVRVIDRGVVRAFLMRCALEADTAHIRPAVVDEFMDLQPTTPQAIGRLQELAHLLLSLMIEPLVDPFDKTYSLGRRHGSISPTLPTHPRDFIHIQITGSGKKAIGRVVRGLRARLAGDRSSGILTGGRSASQGAFLLGNAVEISTGSVPA
jgi:hypothetical protein